MVPLKLAPKHADPTNTHRLLHRLFHLNFLTYGHQTQTGECAIFCIKPAAQITVAFPVGGSAEPTGEDGARVRLFFLYMMDEDRLF